VPLTRLRRLIRGGRLCGMAEHELACSAQATLAEEAVLIGLDEVRALQADLVREAPAP